MKTSTETITKDYISFPEMEHDLSLLKRNLIALKMLKCREMRSRSVRASNRKIKEIESLLASREALIELLEAAMNPNNTIATHETALAIKLNLDIL